MGVEAFANLRVNDAPVVTVDADGPRPKLKIPAPIGTNASAVPAPLPRAGANGKSEPDAAAKEKPRRARGGKNKASGGERDARAADGATPPAPREPRRRGENRQDKPQDSKALNENGEGTGEDAGKKEGKSRGGRGGKARKEPPRDGAEGAAPTPRVSGDGVDKPVSARSLPTPLKKEKKEKKEKREAFASAENGGGFTEDAAKEERRTDPARAPERERDEPSTRAKEKKERAPRDRVSSEPAGAYVPPSRRASEPRDERSAPGKKEKKKKEKSSSAGGEANGEDSQKPAGDRGGGGKSAAGKEIRRFIESGNVDAAMQAFDARAAGGNVDVDTARALLMGLVRACHLHEAFQVADYLKAKSLKLPLKHFTAIILAMSQRANPMDALDLLNALEGSVAYQTKAIHNYHFHFAKLIVQEFLEEALQTLDRIANAPAFGLQENGLAAMDVVIHGGGKGGSLSLGVPALGEELKRGLMKGDTVMLSRTGEAARTMGGVGGRGDGGFTGEMPTGPRGPQNVEMGAMPTGPRGDSTAAPVGGRGGRAGGGWRADFEFEAEVSSMHPNLSVKLIGCDAAQAASVRGGGWRVDKLANRTSFVRQLGALQDMMEVRQGTSQKAGVDSAIRDVLVAGWDGNKADRDAVPDMCADEGRHASLNVIQRQKMIDQAMDLRAMSHMNKSQTDALEAALFQRVTLIQGPPGTGKTHTAVALVQMWLRSRTCPILCTSDSNIAVDNLVDGLSRAGVRVARVGRPEAVRQDLMQYMVESIAGIEPGCTWSKDQQYQAINGVLRRAEVICATCAGAGSDILERFSFEACLIDEATQATEPATVVPLTKGCRQIVLIGDQKQLPPTIISRDADAAGLGTSLFERMLARGIRAFMLKVQYRMHPAIANFPSKAFYKGELLSGTPPSARRAPMGFDWPVPAVPLAFVDVPEGAERSDGSSQTNPAEAQKIVNVVKKLVGGHDVLPCDIGIVTPYAAQVRAIKRLLHGHQPNRRTRFDAPPAPDSMEALEVSTVDGFQGREKEVIVFTCTRANANGNVGFLADPRRVNVMLTRARRGLIVVGHHNTLRRDPTVWGPWLAWASENGLVCGVAATDADSAARLATMGMSSLDEIGGRGAGEVMQMGALLAPNMAGWGDSGSAGAGDGPRLKERKDEDIPDAWDDSDSDDDDADGATTETESATVKGSTNSLAGMADGAWGEESDGETTATAGSAGSPA
jgi:hypothetical protein